MLPLARDDRSDTGRVDLVELTQAWGPVLVLITISTTLLEAFDELVEQRGRDLGQGDDLGLVGQDRQDGRGLRLVVASLGPRVLLATRSWLPLLLTQVDTCQEVLVRLLEDVHLVQIERLGTRLETTDTAEVVGDVGLKGIARGGGVDDQVPLVEHVQENDGRVPAPLGVNDGALVLSREQPVDTGHLGGRREAGLEVALADQDGELLVGELVEDVGQGLAVRRVKGHAREVVTVTDGTALVVRERQGADAPLDVKSGTVVAAGAVVVDPHAVDLDSQVAVPGDVSRLPRATGPGEPWVGQSHCRCDHQVVDPFCGYRRRYLRRREGRV